MALPETRVVAWRRAPDGDGHSLARLEATTTGWSVHGVEVLAEGDERLACTFSVVLDEGWRTREVHVASVSADVREIHLRADGRGSWWDDDGARDDLRGCVDVDVAATPLTNTFPIRRLQPLAAGASATSPVAWVEVPGLAVLRVDQTYRRLGGPPHAQEWEYSDPAHGSFRLVTDSDGVVVTYEGFAERVG